MTPGNKIKNATFDFRFTSRPDLLKENHCLGGFVSRSLVPVIDSVLSGHDRMDSVISIDKLTVDLGRVRFSDYKYQLPLKLKAELDRMLRTRIRNLPDSSNSREQIIPLTGRNLEIIKHFLMTGTLPASANLKRGSSLNQCLQQVMRKEQSGFLKFLNQNTRQIPIIQRLVRQFPESTVRQAIRLLASAQAEAAIKTADNVLQQVQSRSLGGTRSSALKTFVWENLLCYFLQNPGSRLSKSGFYRWIAARAESRAVQAADTSLAALLEMLQKHPAPMNPVLRPEYPSKTAIPKNESRKIFKGYDFYEALLFFLRHGIMPWSAGTITPDCSPAELIMKICTSYPDKLLKFKTDLQYEPGLCRSLAENLPPAEIKQVITSLTAAAMPAEKDRSLFIRSVLEGAERAADRTGYFADILHSIVNSRPVDSNQIAVSPLTPAAAGRKNTADIGGKDPDLILAKLAARLKTGRQSDVRDPEFSQLLGDLAANYPFDCLDFLVWLSEEKKRLTDLLRLADSKEVKKILAPLTGSNNVTSEQKSIIRALDTLLENKRKFWDQKVLSPLDGLPADSLKDKGIEIEIDPVHAANSSPHKPPADKETALIRYLADEPLSQPISNRTARTIFKQMVREGSETLYASLLAKMANRTVIIKMIDLLPENWLTRVLAGLMPNLHRQIQNSADIITTACFSTELFERPWELNRLKWEAIFAYPVQAGNMLVHQSAFINFFIARLRDSSRIPDQKDFVKILLRNLTAGLQSFDRAAYAAVVRELDAAAGKLPHTVQYKPGFGREEKSKPAQAENIPRTGEDNLEEIAVQNAGMVIAAPYLPRLWNILGLTEKEMFKNIQAAERAVHLLQYMTHERTETPEYDLAINKILCGVDLYFPVAGQIDITEKEQEAIEGLIRGMIQNWQTIGRTSVQGFRESFFQRRGQLILRDDAWHLKVEERAFDMLLDSIPWGFSTIKDPWMERVVYVDWR